MLNECLFSSKKDDWITPDDLFDELDNEFNFTLDPCSDSFNHKCDYYFDKSIDGLKMSWDNQVVFMNPPYGKNIGKWVKKAYESNCLVVGLLPARTDTIWFHDYILNKADIRFIKGRIKFVGAKYPAPFPSMIVIWKNYLRRS